MPEKPLKINRVHAFIIDIDRLHIAYKVYPCNIGTLELKIAISAWSSTHDGIFNLYFYLQY